MTAPLAFEVRVRCGDLNHTQSVISATSMDAMILGLELTLELHAESLALQTGEICVVAKPLRLAARPRINCEAAGVCQASTACMNHHACMAEALGLPMNASTGLPT